MTYVLEDQAEFARLEKQSETDLYDYRRELAEFDFSGAQRILDAGCGSGIVSRYLAELHSNAEVVGCDASEERIRQAQSVLQKICSLNFVHGELTALPFPDRSFDAVISRFVLEHLPGPKQLSAVRELRRCLRPGGKICLIDIDGYFHNAFPQPPSFREFMSVLEKSQVVDLNIGRKLPWLLTEAGFHSVQWRVETMEFRDQALATEIDLISDRFNLTLGVMSQLLGSEEHARLVQREYLESLRSPGSVLFYSKFIVTATAPHLKVVLNQEKGS